MTTSLFGINLGYMRLDWEFLCAPHPSRFVHVANPRSEHIFYDAPAMCYVIDHPEGLILFETGLSPDWSSEWPRQWQGVADFRGVTPEVCLERRLDSVGLSSDDFRFVVMGHLHCDHAGGMRIFADSNAEIVIHQDEWDHVQSLQATGTLEDWWYSPADLEVLRSKAPLLVSEDVDLVAGVRTIALPGHTPGTMGLEVQLESTGTVILTSDAIAYHQSYGPPEVGSPQTFDTVAYRSSTAKLRKIAVEREAFILPAHDETGIHQLAESAEAVPIRFGRDHVYE